MVMLIDSSAFDHAHMIKLKTPLRLTCIDVWVSPDIFVVAFDLKLAVGMRHTQGKQLHEHLWNYVSMFTSNAKNVAWLHQYTIFHAYRSQGMWWNRRRELSIISNKRALTTLRESPITLLEMLNKNILHVHIGVTFPVLYPIDLKNIRLNFDVKILSVETPIIMPHVLLYVACPLYYTSL